jgi:Ca2+-binding RTX toxin-like protein
VNGGITVNMAAGTVTGPAAIGTDTLRRVESVRGTNFDDIYDATGFSGSSTNAGSFGTFNDFEGVGGNDIIIGNGNTQIVFFNASAGVTVDLAAGTATGNSSVGSDTFTGVSRVRGSNFADTITGDGSNNVLDGRTGDDTLTGGDGDDQLTGGGGKDTFVFAPGSGKDTITDITLGDPLLNPEADLIDLSALGYHNVSELTIVDNGQGFARIVFGPNDWIDLNGISHTTSLNNHNFIFST